MATSTNKSQTSSAKKGSQDLEAEIAQLREEMARLAEQIARTSDSSYAAARRAANEGLEQMKIQGEAAMEDLKANARDIEQQQVVLVRRDTGEKLITPMEGLEGKIQEVLEDIQQNLLEKARTHREDKTSVAKDFDAFKEQLEEKEGFIQAMWCGEQACEDKIKEEIISLGCKVKTLKLKCFG
jgi:prolyl-tRNA synthetase